MSTVPGREASAESLDDLHLVTRARDPLGRARGPGAIDSGCPRRRSALSSSSYRLSTMSTLKCLHAVDARGASPARPRRGLPPNGPEAGRVDAGRL